MKVTVRTIVICALGTVIKGLVQGLEDLEDERKPYKLQNYWDRSED